ncbi:hypothetical protein [Nocardioides sp.]|uniref:hypothetical protein n=1 Tax=Nocardioides sp. TaxID=35761 RepID=UPI00286A5AAE|nr:hypothetical protein [Nocardioides sp.]
MNLDPRTSRGGVRLAAAALASGAVLATAACSGVAGGIDATTAPTTNTPGTTSSPTAADPSPAVTSLPQGAEKLELDPADFTTEITNPYWPMAPGDTWRYEETDSEGGRQQVVIRVTSKTKLLANGITARVVRDEVRENGELTEATDDWYAQDTAGNIWYLGEDTAEYDHGKVVTREGSFEAGVDGAQGGIAMPAQPRPGMSYRQEYYRGHAEDRATVVTVGEEHVEVPFGYFTKDVLMTRDLVPLEPRVQELKFYAPGVGPVLSVHLDGTGGRATLVKYIRGTG